MKDDPSDRRETFDALFAADPDPWGFESKAYEAAKRRATLTMLFPNRFERALEVGCANGVLTAELASVCDAVLGIDVSSAALRLAESRLADLNHVSLVRAEVPREWPEGTFDLIVFSEILYFLSRNEIARVADLAWQSLSQDGVCLLVNWTGPNDLPMDGQSARLIFAEAVPWLSAASEVRAEYRIDRLHKPFAREEAAPERPKD
ncbi:class I SAM-dependent DNA methyltransferase [Aurantiacibacter spongiae]|uniref:Methyltransferase domain-containing protein n=1 Tax=Aurantiacibacter spongiae TaxID=2488860 RepID=A0A3N5DIP1_9SPHN|nr:SAM-dependent methyltransferase [Aurantiacibacter spongiae]RPF70505.1 methyltransferase domain-containing protein [Aurantiacibacter spongiae]